MYKKEVKYFSLLSAIFALSIALRMAEAAGKTFSPCKQIKIFSEKAFNFSDTEKRLMCGDKKLNAWSEIPLYQAKFFLKSFFQSRGYLNPSFEVKDNTLHVKPGKRGRVREIIVAPQDLLEGDAAEDELRHQFQKTPLTPSTLSAMEASVTGFLRERAYACAKFKAQANAKDGAVVLVGDNLGRYQFGSVQTESLPGLEETAFDRFYPFHPEQPFNAQKLELTEKRLIRDGVVDGSYFIEKCDDTFKELGLQHELLVGPPRVLGFGVGVSTEVGPMFRARWANNRFGPMASSLEAVVRTDLRRQTLYFEADNYLWPEEPRWSILSRVEATREKQVDYEESFGEISTQAKRTFDTWERFWLFSAGPALLSGSFTIDNELGEEGAFSGIALQGQIKSISHDYEIYDFLPKEGSAFILNTEYRSPEFGFEERLLKIEAEHTALGQLLHWGRGHLVGGARFGAYTTVVENARTLESIPPSVKFYGGGSDDIRGFGYRQLPENNGLGALTKALAKFELRKTKFITSSLEAFIFFDTAFFGFDSYELSQRMRQSPGAGLRWVSPVGLFQTFVAKGISTKPYEDEGYVVFVGLGGEF